MGKRFDKLRRGSKKILKRLCPGGNFNLGLFHKDEESFKGQGIGKLQMIKLHIGKQPEEGFINVHAQAVDLKGRKYDMACFEEHG